MHSRTSRFLGMGAALATLLSFVGPARPQQVTVHACATTTVVTGGTAVTAVIGPANGGYIVNPLSATDEGVAAEPLYVDPTTTATTTGNGTNVAIQPGGTYALVPSVGSSTPPTVSVNAATSGHRFSCVRW